ncbi:MAG: MarR family winged helix-turn-helix transcriptional regulator [Methylocystis sp.]
MNELLARKIIEPGSAAAWRGTAVEAAATTDEDALELVELFFFAYRDFVGDADRLLGTYGFGRAHHRVLHFVNRRPGLAIAALLDILRITKQSLNRVLKQLLEAGFVEARAGLVDRRQRLLYPTPQGAKLARDLSALQSARFLKVMDELPPVARGAASEFLFAMIDPDERARVRAHLACAKAAGDAP